MLRDRSDVNCIPINLSHDLSAYAKYNIKFIVQKVTDHFNIDKKGKQDFEEDQVRLERFCTENNIPVYDDPRHVVKMTDRLYFNNKMKELLKT